MCDGKDQPAARAMLRRRGGAAGGAAGSVKLISHTLPSEGQVVGACALLGVLGAMGFGPMAPFVVVLLFAAGWYVCGCVVLAFLAWPFFCEVRHSPLVASLYLKAAGWFKKGVTVWFEEGLVDALEEDNGSLWCMHPHGTSIGMGFSLNGAMRFKAQRPERFLPAEMQRFLRPDRLARMSGVMADVLFKIPLVRPLMYAFGCCQPATKAQMHELFAQRSDFGILPGGMEEVLLYAHGRERVYIAERKGFVKYALQHGYLLVVGYTFGESDLYRTSDVGAAARMRAMKKYGFVTPIFWGPRWWCPVLPDDTVAINTVLGAPLQLPRIENPTDDDVAKYHQQYIDALTTLFETHKHQFGYGDRKLEIL